MVEKIEDTVCAQLLVADFNQCFQHIRHHEESFRRLIEFGGGLALAVCAGYATLVGKYGYTARAMTIGGLMLGVASVAGLFLLAALARMRVQLVLVCRYVNEIRSAFISRAPAGVKNVAGMYTDPARPHNYDPQSAHTIGFYFLALSNAVLFSGCVSTLPPALFLMQSHTAGFFDIRNAVVTFLCFFSLELIMVHHFW